MENENWYCSEVTLNEEYGYGIYSWEIEGDVHSLGNSDPFVVLGLFLYKDDSHELDIEFARWGYT